MTLKADKYTKPLKATAVLSGIAVVVVWGGLFASPSSADELSNARVLAAELRIVRGDLARLKADNSLPPAHIRGLHTRIRGALGGLPWLLRQGGDESGAERLRRQSLETFPTEDQRARLSELLDDVIARHPLDLADDTLAAPSVTQRREAIVLHQTYCAGCHDDAGRGDEDTELPARDLFGMAHESPPDEFLARLINGVKGDETLLFANPLSADQVRALWRYYRAP